VSPDRSHQFIDHIQTEREDLTGISNSYNMLKPSTSVPILTDKCKKYKQDIVKLTNHIKHLNLVIMS